MVDNTIILLYYIYKFDNGTFVFIQSHLRGTELKMTVNIKDMIFTIRGIQVMLDSDVARLYGYETKAINLAANRNADRFPPEFRFRLTYEEREQALRFQFETLKNRFLLYLILKSLSLRHT